MYRLVQIAFISAFLIGHSASADSPSVTAVLSRSEAVVGQTLELDVKVNGADNLEVPRDIVVDGLEIHKTGEQYESQKNFGFGGNENSSSVVYIYTVLPLRAGAFKIPPQTIRVGGQLRQTPELTLNVTDAPGRSSASRPGLAAPNGNMSKLAWAEIIVPKKQAYVGEAIPAEIRIGIDSSVRFDPQPLFAGPEIKVPGMTIQKEKAQRPNETTDTLNGRRVRVFIYKVALTPAKIGRLEFPAELKMTMQWPQRRPQRRSPLDVFGMDDAFQGFFANPFNYTEPTEVTLRSDPVALEVKPLPPNAPPGFSGAVGNFTMSTEAKPTSVQTGDPITVTSTISGRGNFGRVSAPVLEDERGWHKYPPSSKFKQDDDVGISGAKTFETVISPNEKKPAVPPFVFSFFDPAKEKYVTLRGDLIAINVTGNATAAAPAPPALPGSSTPATAMGQTAPKPRDILYQLTDRGRAASFTPIFARPPFWIAQMVPLLALLGLVGWKLRQRRLDNREGRRIAALQQESADLLRKLRRNELSPQEYFSGASRAVRVKTALAKNVDPGAVDVEMAAAAFALDENSRAQVRWLFERNDELRYSGRANGAGTVLPEEREEVLGLIESLRV
ncbi:MAG: BatD family protein [Chthoniobacterales bacterium]